MPAFIEPCQAAIGKIPAVEGWAHEIKFDGYRAQAHINHDKVKLFTRRGHDWTDRFSSIAEALRTLPASTAILDGEIVVADPQGVSNFHWLQADLAARRTGRLMFCVFDLMYLDGFDLRDAPLRERRQALRELIGKRNGRLLFSENIDTDSSTLMDRVCRMKLEGIVSKRLDAPYRSGRRDTWRKIKCQSSDTFPIVAFVEQLGANPRRVASLYLGHYDGEKLLYAGKAQTGYTVQSSCALRELLDPYIVRTSPLAVAVNKPRATWVKPVLQAEIQYSSLTADGLLRAPVYKGLRDDLNALGASEPPNARVRGARPKRSRGRTSIKP